jgi:SAM-dependent methyltransferase
MRSKRAKPWLGRVPRSLKKGVGCNICGWRGQSFEGVPHSESALCSGCGSIARDRFLHWCLWQRVSYRADLELLETSPRLGADYRSTLKARLHYRSSDLDQQTHRGDLVLDLQRIVLPNSSLDVVLTAHVLEHVPDFSAALAELHRVLRPGGHLLVQVPLQQASTQAAQTLEFHGDATRVWWRFGLDLTDLMRKAGFEVAVLVTHDFYRRVELGEADWPHIAPEVDAKAIVRAARLEDLVPVADDVVSRTLAFEPSYMFVTWDCVNPGRPRS